MLLIKNFLYKIGTWITIWYDLLEGAGMSNK